MSIKSGKKRFPSHLTSVFSSWMIPNSFCQLKSIFKCSCSVSWQPSVFYANFEGSEWHMLSHETYCQVAVACCFLFLRISLKIGRDSPFLFHLSLALGYGRSQITILLTSFLIVTTTTPQVKDSFQ